MKRRKDVPRELGMTYRKDGARLSVALVYPNTYSVGMSSLGFLTIYRLLNEMDSIRCDRFFYDSTVADPVGVESGRPLTEYDIVAFSVSFEMDYLNVFRLLSASGIPLRTSQRRPSDPLILAGGVALTLNPEVLAGCLDACVIGEAEDVLETLVRHLGTCLKKGESRSTVLQELSLIPGIYVPQFYTVEYLDDGTISAVAPRQGVPRRIFRQYVGDLDAVHSYSPIVSEGSHFRKMFLIEAGRGCPRKCRFCASGHIYTPVRFRSARGMTEHICSQEIPFQRVGLVGSALSDHPEFETLCRELVESGVELGISSFRADALTPGLIEILVKSGMKTLTLAPEAGSEFLRKRLNKTMTDDVILSAVDMAAEGGMRNLKVYFLLGVPFASDEEGMEIVRLVKKIGKHFSRGTSGSGRVTVSVHPFVPKAWTPFQWCGMQEHSKLEGSFTLIEEALRRVHGLHLTPVSPRQAILQGLFSVGDRRVGEALCRKIESQQSWKAAWKEANIDPAFYVHREKDADEIFPWEVVDAGISRQHLWDEYQRAKTEIPDTEIRSSPDAP